MRRNTLAALAVVVIGIGAVAGSLAGESTQGSLARSDSFVRRYATLLTVVLSKAPLQREPADLVYSSIDGMLDLLDPHTNFLRPELFAQMRERQQGSFHGIGVIISVRGGKITVISPIEGTPAARLGLRAGDTIDAVDGESTDGMELDDAARRLRGPEGTTVRVTVSRPGLPEPLELTIERARVATDSVRYAFLLGSDVAYVRISDFTRTTGQEVRRALDRIQQEGATKLLLDLRDNPGGIVDSAVEAAGMLLEPGQQVFATKGRTADSFQDYRAARDGLHFTGPVIALVNRGSASASEIVAGALQDHDRGLVVGEVSFGKGVVQTIYPVRDAGLALTTAQYYTPSGRCIQRDYDSFFAYVRPHRGDDEEDEQPAQPPTDESQVFFTDAGRKVYGGGGIVPDHQVHLAQFSENLARLVGRSAFFQFAVSYLADKPDQAEAARTLQLTPEIAERFRALVIEEKWLSPEEIDASLSDPTDRRDIATGIRAEVSNAGLSLTDGYRILTDSDDQIQAALKLFDEAAQLQARVRGGATVTASR